MTSGFWNIYTDKMEKTEELKSIGLPTELVQLLTPEQAWHYGILPHDCKTGLLQFFIDEMQDQSLVKEELELIFGMKVQLIPVSSSVVHNALGRYYRRSGGMTERTVKEVTQTGDDFVTNVISEAYGIGSSDIHIEAYEEKCRIRMRIDGKLVERYVIPQTEYPALINKIKIRANLDIAEKRLPQDGRIFFTSGPARFDIRVSVLPAMYGEKVVLRLLSKDATRIDIHQLGFSEQQLDYYLEAIRQPHGIVLISGPTGSGKTTTLYATLKILNQENTNILTIEDPVEYTLEGINQVQLKESIGLTFAQALRTFLRQDPDIIMLGEIRDNETAQMAIRAALTGHLVLSTIHTNSAWGTITRLIDMGVPPFLLAGTLNLSVAQRLVRLLCPHCKKQLSFDKNLFPRNYKQPRYLEHHYVAQGCQECFYTGYKGRKAVYEIIPVDDELAQAIRKGESDISSNLKARKIKTLSDSAFELFEEGMTSVEEVYSILMNGN